MKKVQVTALVQTKNEQAGIGACLDGLAEFDEVIVIDSNSEDRTQDIARERGARVVNFTWDKRYPKKKQWQLENVATRNEWVLFIDADERPTRALMEELHELFGDSLPAGHLSAFDIDLDYVFAGKLLRYGHRVTKRCLVRKGHVSFPVVDDLDIPGMGELEGHYQPRVEGLVARLRGRILHNDIDPVSSWFARHNRYSDWEAALRVRKAVGAEVARTRTLKGRIFDAVPFKPMAFFVYAYVARLGFLDGRPGFDYAFALSSYYWQIGLKTRELHRASMVKGGI